MISFSTQPQLRRQLSVDLILPTSHRLLRIWGNTEFPRLHRLPQWLCCYTSLVMLSVSVQVRVWSRFREMFIQSIMNPILSSSQLLISTIHGSTSMRHVKTLSFSSVNQTKICTRSSITDSKCTLVTYGSLLPSWVFWPSQTLSGKIFLPKVGSALNHFL